MVSRPPQTTLILEGVPKDASGKWLIGIDTQFFNVTDLLHGIKLIPEGVHLFHYSVPVSPTEDTKRTPDEPFAASSLRHAFWFECRDGDILLARWDSELERLVFVNPEDTIEELNYTKALSNLGELYTLMVTYPEDPGKWLGLTNFIDFELIQDLLPLATETYSGEISTIMSSREENMVLLDTLKSKNPTQQYEEQSNSELKYTIFEFKRPKDASQGVEDITTNYLDKSWYLEELYAHDMEFLLGEMQVSFLNFVLLGNFCSGIHWCNMLKLVLMLAKFMIRSQAFSLKFLDVLKDQLHILPKEYLVDDVGQNTFIDLRTYADTMENFTKDIIPTWEENNANCCGKMKMGGVILEKWSNIVILHKQQFGLDLNSLGAAAVDENNMEVYDLDQYDENDEDAPAIVS